MTMNRHRSITATGKTVVFSTAIAMAVIPSTVLSEDAPNPKKNAPTAKEEKAPAPTKNAEKNKKGKDYAKAFDVFRSLGLPDLSNATFGQADFSNSAVNIYIEGTRLRNPTWLLSKDQKTGKMKLVFRQSAIISAVQSKQNGNDGKLQVTWVKEDLKTTVRDLLASLEKQVAKDNPNVFMLRTSLGDLLLFAVALDGKGMRQEANKLTELVFLLGKNKKKVIEQALDAMANAKYTALYMEFIENDDWKAFADGMDKLLSKFGTVWKNAPGVEKLESLARAKAENKTTPLKGLSKKDAEIADALLGSDPGKASAGLWTLDPPKKEKTEARGKKETASKENAENKRTTQSPTPVERVMQRGIEALPLLAAMLGDDTLLQRPLNSIVPNENENTRFSHVIIYGEEEIEKPPEEIFEKLSPRPATRGELARVMLAGVVPEINKNRRQRIDSMEEGSPHSPEEMRKQTMEWYAKTKGKTQIELAKLYLKDGSPLQITYTMNCVLKNKMEKLYPEIEKCLLQSEKRNSSYYMGWRSQLATRYAEIRGSDARKFVLAFLEKMDPGGKIRNARKDEKPKPAEKETKKGDAEKNKNAMFISEPSRTDDMRSWQITRIKDMANELMDLTSNATPEDILAEIADGKKDLNYFSRQLLVSKMKKTPPDDRVKLFLEYSVKALENKKNDVSEALAWMAALPPTRKHISDDGKNKSEREKPDISKHADLWRKLLNSKETFPREMGKPRVGISFNAACCIETIYAGTNPEKLIKGHAILGRFFDARILERAKKRIEGTPEDKLPPLPTAALCEKMKFDDAAKTKAIAVADKLAGSPSPADALNKLTLKEMALLTRLFEKDGEKSDSRKKLGEALAKRAGRIVEIEIECEGVDSKTIEQLKGKSLGVDTKNTIIDFLEKHSKGKNDTYVHAFRKPMCGGVKIRVTNVDDGSNRSKGPQKGVWGFLDLPYDRLYVTWSFDQLKSEKKNGKEEGDAASEEDDPLAEMEDEINEEADNDTAEKQKRFEKALEEIASGKTNPLCGINMVFTGIRGEE